MTIVQEKDYITNTKASGYRSYHIIIRYPLSTALGPKEVFAEIQIRTNAMNFWDFCCLWESPFLAPVLGPVH